MKKLVDLDKAEELKEMKNVVDILLMILFTVLAIELLYYLIFHTSLLYY